MKKSRISLVIILLILILFVPIPTGTYKDGGTKEYTALTYKIVKWRRLTLPDGRYEKTKIYLFPLNFKSIDALWYMEEKNIGKNRERIPRQDRICFS